MRFSRKRISPEDERGLTLIERTIVAAIIGILAVAIPLYVNIQANSRISKAQADIRTLVGAVSAFSAHTQALPAALANLTSTAADPQGVTAGPWMGSIPTPPTGWTTAYSYTVAGGLFTVSASGDGTTVSLP